MKPPRDWTTALFRLSGATAGMGAGALWGVLLLGYPYGAAGRTAGTLLIGMLMMGVAVAGAVAAAAGRPLWMGALALVSLIPEGLYLAGTPGLFRWIAAFDLYLLVAAVLIYLRQRKRPPAGE